MNPSAPASQAAREACGRWFLANRSVEAAPNDPAALVGRAASFLAMDRPWEATNDLDRALRMQKRLAGADVAAAGDETTANQRRRRHDGEEARTRLLRRQTVRELWGESSHIRVGGATEAIWDGSARHFRETECKYRRCRNPLMYRPASTRGGYPLPPLKLGAWSYF